MKILRALLLPAVARFARRYPGVALTLAVWRWWQRRSARSARHVVRLRRNESVTIERSGGVS